MKQFKAEDKLWVLEQLKFRKTRPVAVEFYYRHHDRYANKGLEFNLILIRIEWLFLDWINIKKDANMENLKSQTGKIGNKRGEIKVDIND